jgi:uncharacterized protein YxeA
MKHLIFYRFALVCFISLSCYSYHFVNCREDTSSAYLQLRQDMMEQQKEAQTDKTISIPIPDLTLFHKALEILKKMI